MEESIKQCIEERLKVNDIESVCFDISPKNANDAINNPIIEKIKNLFNSIGVNCRYVDTVLGSFNLNRD